MELHRTERLATKGGQFVEVKYLGVAAHTGQMRTAILNLKYRGQRRVARELAVVVASALKGLSISFDDAVMTWAPTSRQRVQTRSYDQSELIARHVGALVRVPVRRLLRRTNSRHQTGRSRSERLASVAFVSRSVRRSTVILVDDVTTTGATFRAAAQALVNGGARKVICIAPSRTMENVSKTRSGSGAT